MRNFSKILVAATLIAGVSAPAFAQPDTATATANSTANILRPITLANAAGLTFGSVTRPTTGTNSLVINSGTGARSLTGGGNGVILSSSAFGRATFNVGGEGAQAFSISVPATFDLSNGTDTVTVTLAASAASGTLDGTIGGAGAATFGVGGTLPLSSSSVGGAYTGSFAATVTYN